MSSSRIPCICSVLAESAASASGITGNAAIPWPQQPPDRWRGKTATSWEKDDDEDEDADDENDDDDDDDDDACNIPDFSCILCMQCHKYLVCFFGILLFCFQCFLIFKMPDFFVS